jgi:NADP-dependent 3-hydroxy acid dehydrogenase YdfG
MLQHLEPWTSTTYVSKFHKNYKRWQLFTRNTPSFSDLRSLINLNVIRILNIYSHHNMTTTLPENAVWFITGCSSGLGQELSKLLSQTKSYRLVATARKLSALSYLPDDSTQVLKLALDVNSPASITSAVSQAVEKFGQINVLINNAGYGLLNDFEAISNTEARTQFETNFWGAVNLTREVLPIFREVNPAGQGGVVVQVSSMGGYIGFPGNSFYHASKFALEGFTEGVAKEMYPEWNIKFMIFEPGGVKTGFSSNLQMGPRHPAYADPKGPTNVFREYMQNPKAANDWADPILVVQILVKVVEAGDIPLRLPIGRDAWGLMSDDVDKTRKEFDKWKSVSESSSSPEQVEGLEFLRK